VGAVKIFFASDFHGSERVFRKFVNSGKHYGAGVLIGGGDITGKMIVPLVEHPDGTRHASYFGSEVVVTTEEALKELEGTLRSSGFYYALIKLEDVKSYTPEKIDELFHEKMKETIYAWVALAEERLKPAGIECFLMPGNDDHTIVDEALESSDYVVNADQKVVQVGPFEMITVGHANITPWMCPRDVPEEELAAIIDELAVQVKDMSRCIFNLHVPPYESGLDIAPQLDKDLKPRMDGSELKMIPVGSHAVRAAIEKYQPMLGLHGHIHESRGARKIGRTVCVNPGSEYQQGILRGVFLNIDDKKLKIDWAFTTG
jgi:uncharacterized protein